MRKKKNKEIIKLIIARIRKRKKIRIKILLLKLIVQFALIAKLLRIILLFIAQGKNESWRLILFLSLNINFLKNLPPPFSFFSLDVMFLSINIVMDYQMFPIMMYIVIYVLH